VVLLASNVVDCGFKPLSNQTDIGIGCFCIKHTALRNKSKDLLDENQINLSELSDVYPQTVVSVS